VLQLLGRTLQLVPQTFHFRLRTFPFVEKGTKTYVVRKINGQILAVGKLKLVENVSHLLNDSPFMLKASLCRFSASRLVFQRLNGESALPPFHLESLLLAVKVSLKTGCGLVRRLCECGIPFPFVVKSSDPELVELVDVTDPEQLIGQDALLVLKDVVLPMKILIREPFDTTRRADRWIYLLLLSASGFLRGAGSLNHPERLMLGADCLALRCHVCDNGALFREVDVKAW